MDDGIGAAGCLALNCVEHQAPGTPGGGASTSVLRSRCRGSVQRRMDSAAGFRQVFVFASQRAHTFGTSPTGETVGRLSVPWASWAADRAREGVTQLRLVATGGGIWVGP